jgi:hypothetical protein
MAQTSLNSTGVASSGSLVLQSNGTTAAVTIDISQNVGVGVTPSAWKSNYKASQVGNATAVAGRTDNNNNYFSSNWYVNSSNQDIYQNTGFATLYSQGTGTHAWYNAPSGTAGNAITFTQAMTLDASGNLGVGATSPSAKLTVTDSNGIPLRIGDISSAPSSQTACYVGTATSGLPNSTNGDLVLIPRTSTTSAITFWSGNGTAVERARIDSSGNLLVGTTTTGGANSGSTTFRVSPGAWDVNHENGTGSGAGYVAFYYNATTIGSITQSGTTGVLYNVASDQRLKENIVDAPEFGNVIDSIKVRSFDWITDQTHQRSGFVAQELVTVAPEAVYQPTNTDEMMAVDYSKLVPMLVKEIQSLRQRVAQLESN